MARRSVQVSYWVFWPMVLGLALMLPAILLRITAPHDNSVPLPGPGKTTVFYASNGDFPAHKPFVLSYDVVVDPVRSTVGMPNRPAVPCRFRLVANDAGKQFPIIVVEQLRYAAEYYSGNVASFSSEPFDMPPGTGAVSLTNLGCRQGYAFEGGLARIGPEAGDNLLIPIGAEILKWIGIFSAALGLCIALARYLIAPVPTTHA